MMLSDPIALALARHEAADEAFQKSERDRLAHEDERERFLLSAVDLEYTDEDAAAARATDAPMEVDDAPAA